MVEFDIQFVVSNQYNWLRLLLDLGAANFLPYQILLKIKLVSYEIGALSLNIKSAS